jgi:hypothetical protein
MIKHHPKLIALHGLVLAACLVVLAGCAGTGNNSTPSDPAATAISVPPSSPSATAGNATVTLNWTASSTATAYNVKRATTSGGPYTQIGAPTSTSYTDTSLTNGTTYYYVVSALNSAGASANSTQVSATPTAPVGPVSIPATPSGLAATSGNAQASLTWTASSGATSYHVKRATTSGGPYTQIGAPTATSYTDTSLANGTTYYYVVSALDSAGESANSTQVSATPAVPTTSLAACNLTSPAFCDTFDEGPTSAPGREGDLDSTKWSVARLAPQDISGAGGAVSNPVEIAPIPACKASFTSTSVYPPYDTLICDPSGTRGSQLLTAVAIQNYGVNSYMIRQPFDFSGRTGKVDFDVDDGGGYQLLGGYPEINITQDPASAPTFQEFQNFETGPVPQNAIIVKFSQGNNCSSTQASPVNVMVYNGYAPTILPSSSTIGCVNISPGAMNHYEIQLSQTTIDIYGTDYSTDNGQTFTNLHKIYSAAINLPFSRGYVHIGARNHATVKYGFGPDAVLHWDNIGFDGPVITNTLSYEIPDNTTMATYMGHTPGSTAPVMNLGYQLQDGTVSGKPAGIYDPVNKLPPFQFKNVNTSGMISALLSFNAFLNSQSAADTTWGWKYRFNGGTWITRTLTPLEVTAIDNKLAVGGGGSGGNISMLVNVAIGDLIDGTNTFEILPLNAPMNYPPVIANIDLTLSH